MPVFLTVEDVLHIHERVCRDFEGTDDPVDTPGVRSRALLESAVARQWCGLGNVLKYPDAYANAATLAFGLCNDHPFHNGNKRTALVAMIAHLHANSHTIYGTKQQALYVMIKDVATHTLGERPQPRGRPKTDRRRDADEEVEAIRKWLRANARRIDKADRRITYRQLRRVLEGLDFVLDDARSGKISVCRKATTRNLLLQKKPILKRVGTIGWTDEGKTVGRGDLRHIREICRLREQDGYDSKAFFEGSDPVDVWINDYRTVLDRLSKE